MASVRDRRTSDVAVRAALVIMVLLTGLAAALEMSGRSERSAEALRAELAARAAIDIRSTTQQIVASLSGVNAWGAADGSVDERAFREYAAGALAHTSLAALAYEPVVRGADRARFEAELGRAIHTGPSAASVTSPLRDVYYPVRFVSPLSDTTRRLLGFDIGSEPVRAAAARTARDTGALQITRPVRSQPSNEIAVFVVQPLYAHDAPVRTVEERRAANVGFITTAFAGERYLDAAARSFPSPTSLESASDMPPRPALMSPV